MSCSYHKIQQGHFKRRRSVFSNRCIRMISSSATEIMVFVAKSANCSGVRPKHMI